MSTKNAKFAITQAFVDRSDLANGLLQILNANPTTAETLASLASYVTELRTSRTVVLGNGPASPNDPASKKRKLQHNPAAASVADPSAGPRHFDLPDTSFSAPVRKKLRLVGTNAGIAGLSSSSSSALTATNGAGGEAEAALAWTDIGWLFCLPMPDKAKATHSFVALPRDDAEGAEAIVWTAAPAGDGAVGELVLKLNGLLERCGAGTSSVVLPAKDEFVSRVGKGGAFGTRTHRGTKEGYLFFLGPGILWAFKKPILFLPFHNIVSISYTSVLQRTFNLVVTARERGAEETEIEFAMVDQDDFAGIDAYVKRHGLNDASLAASRRAKIYNVNAPKGAAAGAPAGAGAEAEPVKAEEANGAEENGGETELQKAERMLQDQEDEMEEDYVDEEGDEEGSSDDESYAEGEEGEEGEDADGGGSEEEDEEDESGFVEEEEFDEEVGGYEDE